MARAGGLFSQLFKKTKPGIGAVTTVIDEMDERIFIAGAPAASKSTGLITLPQSTSLILPQNTINIPGSTAPAATSWLKNTAAALGLTGVGVGTGYGIGRMEGSPGGRTATTNGTESPTGGSGQPGGAATGGKTAGNWSPKFGMWNAISAMVGAVIAIVSGPVGLVIAGVGGLFGQNIADTVAKRSGPAPSAPSDSNAQVSTAPIGPAAHTASSDNPTPGLNAAAMGKLQNKLDARVLG